VGLMYNCPKCNVPMVYVGGCYKCGDCGLLVSREALERVYGGRQGSQINEQGDF